MARRPGPALPDVFARPGAAPARGTPIEDLPQDAAPPEPVAEPPPPPPPAIEPQPVRYQPPAAPVAAPRSSAFTLAIVALVISLTAPFWADYLLPIIGIRTTQSRIAEQDALAVTRQQARSEDVSLRLAALSAQITSLQTALANATRQTEQTAAMTRTMALVRLSETLRRPMPFGAELALVRASGTDLGDVKPLLDRIEPYAATGIPGTTQLRQDFHTLADQVVRTDHALMPASWMNNLATWAHLRTASPPAPAGDPSLDLLRDATARLADGDVAGALEQATQLSDTYKPAFASWIEDAQARVAADTLAERTDDMVTKTLK
jgi:hypothetical protein